MFWKNILSILCMCICCCSVTQLCLTLYETMDCSTPSLPCPSPSPRVSSNSFPLSQCCHPTISSSVAAFSLPQHLGLSQWACSSNFPRKHFFKCIYFNQLDHTIRKRSESDNKLMNLGCSIVWPTCSFVCFLLLLQLLFVLPVHPFQKRINQQFDILENILYTLIFSGHLIHL